MKGGNVRWFNPGTVAGSIGTDKIERVGGPRVYRIIRFRFDGRPRTLRKNLTLAEAQAHCQRSDTSSHTTGPGSWFDGYDYMKGCAPKVRP